MTRSSAAVVAAGIAFTILLSLTTESGGQNIGTPLPATATAPGDNPTTPAKVALGRLLFWDPIMSGNRDVACASCHHPRFGYAENRALSIGVNGTGLGSGRRFSAGNTIPIVKRNSPTILNVAFAGIDEAGRYAPVSAPMFWDRRVQGLEAQALEPLKSFEEMRGNAYPIERAVDTVVARLNGIAEYGSLFAAAFAGESTVTVVNLARAIAAFERALIATSAPFDRYQRGEAGAMNASQLRGMRRFDRIGCDNCHKGPMFSDYLLHVLGVPENPAAPETDRGADNRFAFRTASLRNLSLTGPFMHNGVFRTLEDVLEFYDDVDSQRGRARNVNVSRQDLDPLLRRLRGVDEDDQDLIAFLGALSDPAFDRTIPPRVPSGLTVGGRIQ